MQFNVAVFVLYFCYIQVMLLLLFYYDSVILPLNQKCNTTLLFILRYLYGSTDEYVTKELLIEAMFCSNKRKCIETFPQGVSIRTCLRSVQEYGYALGKI